MRLKLLILTPFRTVPGFQKFVMSRILLWQLDAQGIAWELHRPWRRRRDLQDFDAVLTWTFSAAGKPRFLASCRKFEERAEAAGLPVVNSIAGYSKSHTHFLDQWRRQGIPCPRYQPFSDLDEIRLPYPLVLRSDSSHRGRDMFLVHDPDEARRLVEGRRREAEAAGEELAELDLAIEFIDTRRDDGYTYVHRCHVVGDRVLPGYAMRSRSPFVNFSDAALDPASCLVDRQFVSGEVGDRDLMRRAARAVERDVVALDYAHRRDGRVVFWEANCSPGTAGDTPSPWLELRESDDDHGRAVAELVLARAGRAAPG